MYPYVFQKNAYFSIDAGLFSAHVFKYFRPFLLHPVYLFRKIILCSLRYVLLLYVSIVDICKVVNNILSTNLLFRFH
jgi:hypothetical protein